MNRPELDVPPELAERVARELAPEEKVIWAGQPRPDLAVRPAYLLVPFGFVFTAIAIFWMVMAATIAFGVMALCGLPFIVVGIGLILSPLWLRSMARRTAYVLTDRRALILQPTYFGWATVQSFTAAGLGQMTRTERSGDLVFQVISSGYGDNARSERRGFLGIDRVREVEELVRRTLQARE